MPTLNDFGDAAVARVEQQAQKLARDWNVPKEALYGYFNETAHFPTGLDELRAWGDQVTKYGVSRRDPATGAWHPIMPGVNPDPRLTSEDRGGFPHNINNAEDSQIQRFQQVDANGNVFGGSWNPQLNAQHPEWAGKTGIETAGVRGDAVSGQAGGSGPGSASDGKTGGVTAPQVGGRFQDAMNRYMAMVGGQTGGARQTAQVQPMRATIPGVTDQVQRTQGGTIAGGYVAEVSPGDPNTRFVSVVNGVPNVFDTREEANRDQSQRSGGGTVAAPSAGAGGVTAPATGGASGGASPGGGPSFPGVNLGERQIQITAAYNDAQLAYLYEKMRLIDQPLTEAQIDQMAMNAAHQAVADGLAQKKYENIDLPMLKLQQDQLTEQKRQFEKTFGLQQGQLDLSRQQAATDATLRGTQIASQEATTRAQIGTQALQSAEQLGLGRQQAAQQGLSSAGQLAQAAQDAARSGFLGAESAGAQRGGLAQSGFLGAESAAAASRNAAQSGFLGAENLARGADDYALNAAKALNDTALAAIQLSGQYRGPKDAWVQQQVNRGLNAAGLSSDVGAIAGEYDPAGFQAPQARPQAASLGTVASGILGAGVGGPGVAGGQPSANDIIRRQVMARIADPYGQGGRAALQQAGRMAADPYGAGGRAALQQAGQVASDYYGQGGRAAMDLAGRQAADPYGAAGSALMGLAGSQIADPYGVYGRQLGAEGANEIANQYASPSSLAAQRVAWQNMPEAQANGPTAALRGSGARINQAWAAMRAQLGRNPTGQETAALISSITGLPADISDRIGAGTVDYFVNTNSGIPDDLLEQQVIQAATSVAGLGSAPGAIGAPTRLDRDYWNLRRQVGGYPSAADPMVQRMYREEGSPNPALSAWNSADYARVGGYAMPWGPMVGNVTAPTVRKPVPADTPGWAFPPTGPSADPFGEGKVRFTDMVKPRALAGVL